MVEYGTVWILRFQGKLTQGPNAGRYYSFANNWGGATFTSLALAEAKLAEYRQREPHLAYQVLTRQWIGGKKGGWCETVVAEIDNGTGSPDAADYDR